MASASTACAVQMCKPGERSVIRCPSCRMVSQRVAIVHPANRRRAGYNCSVVRSVKVPLGAAGHELVMAINVMLYGLGPIGAAVAGQIAARKGFRISGGIDTDPAKIGRDLGDVAGMGRQMKVRITNDAVG